MPVWMGAEPLIQIRKAHCGLRGPGDGKLLLRIEQPALIGHFSRGNFIGAEVLAGRECEDVDAADDFGAIYPPLIPVGRPVATGDKVIIVDRTTIKVGDLDGVGGVGEVDD